MSSSDIMGCVPMCRGLSFQRHKKQQHTCAAALCSRAHPCTCTLELAKLSQMGQGRLESALVLIPVSLPEILGDFWGSSSTDLATQSLASSQSMVLNSQALFLVAHAAACAVTFFAIFFLGGGLILGHPSAIKFWHCTANLQCNTQLHVHCMQFTAPQTSLRHHKPHVHVQMSTHMENIRTSEHFVQALQYSWYYSLSKPTQPLASRYYNPLQHQHTEEYQLLLIRKPSSGKLYKKFNLNIQHYLGDSHSNLNNISYHKHREYHTYK